MMSTAHPREQKINAKGALKILRISLKMGKYACMPLDKPQHEEKKPEIKEQPELGEHEKSEEFELEEPNPTLKDPALMRELLLGSLELLNSNKVQAAKILLAEALKDL